MAQERGHDMDVANRSSQVDLRKQVALIEAPTRVNWELTEAELARVTGGSGDPGTVGDRSGIATPILF
jgi:hypothetical protein